MDLKGIIPILQTPFTADGMHVDYEDLAKEVDTLICEGVNGVALFGVATEFYKLSDKEKKKMVETVVGASARRIPVIASITRNSTELALQDARTFQELGTDALMMFAPHFIKPSAEALKKHIIEVANSVQIPFIIQYTPSLGGTVLSAGTVMEMKAAIRNPLYIKAECSPPGPFVEMLSKGTGGEMGIFCGNAGLQMLDLFDRGATGLMPGCSMAKAFVRFYQEYSSGNREFAKNIADFISLMSLLTNQTEEMFIRFEKAVLVRRGIFKTDLCRKPTGYDLDEKIWKAFLSYRETLMTLIGP